MPRHNQLAYVKTILHIGLTLIIESASVLKSYDQAGSVH